MDGGASESPFSPAAILAVVVVGIVAFCGLMVLLAYAPDLRTDNAGGASALSKSAVGFAGLERSLKAAGIPTVISRIDPKLAPRGALMVITPLANAQPAQTRPFARASRVLIILPKWRTRPVERSAAFVAKAGLIGGPKFADRILNPFSTETTIARRGGESRPVLRFLAGDRYAEASFTLDKIDRLQTLSGEAWIPLIVDEQDHIVLAANRQIPNVFVLADPDILNNQGFSKLANARAGLLLIDLVRGGRPVAFDVTLNGFARGQGMLRLLFEPPWLAATLCGLAAAVLIGLHALGRFGSPRDETAALAPGRRTLVDNSAALVRMARKEAQMAPPYAELTWSLMSQAAGSLRARGEERDQWLEDMARLRGLESPAALNAEAVAAKSRGDLLTVVQKLHSWKREALGGGR